jgi:hypothetical protein
MSYLTLEVEVDHGRIVPAEPEKLPGKEWMAIVRDARL